MRLTFAAAAALAVMTTASLASAQGRQDFTLVNRTGYTIDQVYVAPSSSDDWGNDVLGRDTLANRESVHITFNRSTRVCKWDVQVIWTDESKSEWEGFDLCTVSKIIIYYDRNSDRAWAEYE